MQTRQKARKLLDLARVMVKQARILRDDGFTARAREVARRAIAIDRLAWTMLRPEPAPVRIVASRRLH
ncbi:hypothetical protein [Salinarimonas ramus]|uniref:Uncharacterized protein n=1 Tax=Salinarimonas ramus TaxID=690164 RepID=A0A917QGD8_9HYPH|nr:hypothetical protein [Salinarimonas ramus]GGK49363.1 hypothetical protein GCM10011322_40500 [Salinarimonas ramus]